MSGKLMECLICCQKSDLFGIGSCLHPVCMECCIRLRISDKSKSCPQCMRLKSIRIKYLGRADIENLYFVKVPYDEEFKLPKEPFEHSDSTEYGIKFEDKYAMQCYESYLAYSCKICTKDGNDSNFGSFDVLKHHYGQAHQLSFCHICYEHLNILPKNRIAYTKEDLKKHMDGGLNEYGFTGV